MKQRSIRFRLTIWYALALTTSLGLFAFIIWFSLRQSLNHDVDTSLAQRAVSLESFVKDELDDPAVKLPEELDEYAHALPQNTFMRVQDERNSIVFMSGAAFPWRSIALHSEPGSVPRILSHGHAYRVRITKVPIKGKFWTLSLAAPLDNIDRLLDRLRILLITLIPAVIVVGSLGGSWLSRRALKPVDEITAAARSISIESLSKRLAVPFTGDELQRLSETWNSMLERLENAVKRLTRFTADASHELRTPLAIIRSTAEIAQRRSRSADAYREALSQIVAESEHMTELVEDLLFLARCDAETLEIVMSRLNLTALVKEVCSGMAALAESNAVSLYLQLPENAVFVRGSESSIRRLLLILVDNAVKYSRRGGCIRISLNETQEEAVLAVADSGPGITDSDLPNIFERFYRAPGISETTSPEAARPTTERRGFGLGLSLAAGIVQHHNARISVHSVPEQGSTFTVTFAPVSRVT
jgi:two-component system, OmpR family, heavy metal sensor histidine kinase CusS